MSDTEPIVGVIKLHDFLVVLLFYVVADPLLDIGIIILVVLVYPGHFIHAELRWFLEHPNHGLLVIRYKRAFQIKDLPLELL